MASGTSAAGNRGANVRALQLVDVAAVAEILCKSPGAAAWSAESLAKSLSSGAYGWVSERDGKVAGALIGRIVADEFEILNLAVAETDRRQGNAGALIECALEFAEASGCTVAHLEVRASNSSAIALYCGRGFREIGRRKQYYQNPDEDALLLAYGIGKK